MIYADRPIFARVVGALVVVAFADSATGCGTRLRYGEDIVSGAQYNVENAARESGVQWQIVGQFLKVLGLVST